APWTPPGWVFGTAWTFIMLCFAFYMDFAWQSTSNQKRLAMLYSTQWILNSAWSPVFFHYHMVNWALFIILALTALITYFLFAERDRLKVKTVFVLPYFLWLLIAVALNAYISLEN
ncbi:MAG: tryptophan-rich sensory protein, partial [Opitutales bacterium]|nr:tryptophan-rich sensory protein [Opitutales bacterium]